MTLTLKRGRLKYKAAAAGLAAGLHGVLLAPLLLAPSTPLHMPAASPDDGRLLLVRLEPRSPSSRDVLPENTTPDAPLDKPARSPTRAPPRSASPSAGSIAGSEPVIDEAWRYRAESVVGPDFRIPGAAPVSCLEPLERLPADQRALCSQRAAALAAARARIAELDPAAFAASIRPDRDGWREDAFARQAQANEDWRDYTRGDGAYPGLRSLLKDR